MRIIYYDALPGPQASLTGYLHDAGDEFIQRHTRPCVIVCPGGAYELLATHEAEPAAIRFYQAGYQAFILNYSLYNGSPLGLAPLYDASAALSAIREHAEPWRVNPAAIALCGFSAGGHLAASLGTLYDLADLREKNNANRPDALILCYPVITGKEPVSKSILNLTGEGDRSLFSLEHRVTSQTPPTFIWHTSDDQSVPAAHSLLFLDALRQNGVPFESHIYAHGPHGLSLATAETTRRDAHIASWSTLCLEWLGKLFNFE